MMSDGGWLYRIAGEPQWAVCGESFPVGCRFDAGIACSQFFSVNPDRRSRLYNTPTGMYKPGQGLASVFMSWSAAEYLYMLLLLNRTLLPPQALFVIRYQKVSLSSMSPDKPIIALQQPGWCPRKITQHDKNIMGVRKLHACPCM